MNLKQSMTNDELQKSIIETHNLIRGTYTAADFYDHLTKHLITLLDIQRLRAATVFLPEKDHVVFPGEK